MSFTSEKENFSAKVTKTDVDVCYRTCRYAVNTSTGQRRLLGCTDWDCVSLPGFELTVAN